LQDPGKKGGFCVPLGVFKGAVSKKGGSIGRTKLPSFGKKRLSQSLSTRKLTESRNRRCVMGRTKKAKSSRGKKTGGINTAKEGGKEKANGVGLPRPTLKADRPEYHQPTERGNKRR